ncbi:MULTISPECIES: DMT family transporter [Pseudomonadaceae]|uniref:DMT family transporter n=1 Tax=Pseudomonadaceae TaxID=135621 RepID=UPI000F7696F7|nr:MULTISPECIES: EamA family transporter [Pseudomonadaceae]MBE7927662.1 EamA family transporter [Pseudomonas saudiphocaensis]MCF6780996.1 DMT family transporter [Stutzerimonas stutzeri]MCF6803564.1 DMT family transporter [Stutzerimonas stutzeri]RRV17031.1 EamA family transporter [Pseudomonas saudiphocaensis]
MPETTSRTTLAHLGMLLWAAFVGLSFPAVGLLGEGLPPLLLTCMRFTIAALVLAPLAWKQSEGLPRVSTLLLYALMGLCLAGFFGTMFWAAHRVTALSMATLFVSVPLLAYCLGRGLGVEQPAGRLLAVLALGASGALGLAWAENGGNFAGMQLGLGELGFFFGCVASALYPVLSKWGLARGVLPKQAGLRTFWSLVCGAVLIGLMGLLWESPGTLLRMNLLDLLLVTYLGVFSSAMTFFLQQRATSVLTPGAVTAYSYLVPFVSMLLLFFDQPARMGWHWAPGALLVVVAIVLLLRQEPASR